jgi:hypothetical protein
MAFPHAPLHSKPSKQQLMERLIHELEGQDWTTIRVVLQMVRELLYEKEHRQLAFDSLSYEYLDTDYTDEGRALVVTIFARKMTREPKQTAGTQH